nr:immunoglobulin light chain junction region [Macaca mulatta]MOX52594.1 immunoglobulin light chain junction region [Macaca mulatta]
CLQYYSDPWTF